MLLRSFCSKGFKFSRLAGIRWLATDAKPAAIWEEEIDEPAVSQNDVKDMETFGEINPYENEDVLLEDDLKTEKDVEKLLASLRKVEEGESIIGSGLVKDHLHKLSIDEIHSPDDTSSRPLNRWRKIIYDDGELDKSDLSLPPSKNNPHPFNENYQKISLPPTHARSMAAYVNHSKVLQNLLDLGVDLLDVDTKTTLSRYFVRMDWEKDVFPRLSWLVKKLDVDSETLGSYITRNPFFLIQNLAEMKERVSYLESKKFSSKQISKIVIENRYWLNTDVKTTDARLGWIQRQFNFTGNDLRNLITKEPRLTYSGLGPLQRLVLLFNKELRFSKYEVKKMLMDDPRVFMIESRQIVQTYNYLVLVMNIPNHLIAEYPLALRCRIDNIRRRHEFLRKINKAVYDPELPDYVSLKELLQPSDRKFASNVARAKLEDYNRFMKIL